MDGGKTALPDTWTRSSEGLFCLTCRREQAASNGSTSAPKDSTGAARAKLRRDAMLEFEVSRVPDRSNGEIARACRSSAAAVARARRRLELPDPPQPSATVRSTYGESRRRSRTADASKSAAPKQDREGN